MNIIEKILKFRLLDGTIQYLTSGNVWKKIPYLLSDDLYDELKKTDLVLVNNIINWELADHFTLNLSDDTELFDINLPIYPEIKEILLTVTPNNNNLTLPPYWRVTTNAVDTAVDNFLRVVCVNNTSQAKSVTVTLSGTTGTADISLAGGLTNAITFNEDLATTASDFVTTFAENYLAEKIIVTSDGKNIIFTAQYPGYNFVSPELINASDDLAGEVEDVKDNISPIVWCSVNQQIGVD